jgi:arylsulfatase A-like enzyme
LSAFTRALDLFARRAIVGGQGSGALPRLVTLALVGPSVWIVILLIDSYITGGRRLGISATALVIEIGLRQSAWIVLSCGALLLLRHALAGRIWLARGLILLALALPCVDQALFLTAGDGIAGHPHIRLIRVGLSALLLAFSAATVEWLQLGLRAVLPSQPARALWLASGLLGLTALAWGVRLGLEFYAYFAAFLGFALATLAMGLPLTWRWRRRGLSAAALIQVALLSFVIVAHCVDFGPPDLDAAPLANLARVAVGPHRAAGNDTLDFKDPARFRCRAPDTRSSEHGFGIAKERRKNVILISVDALRGDMLHLSEGGHAVMPSLAAFASQAVEFTQAFSSYPATIYALGSAFTGYSPSELLLAPTLPPSLLRRAEGSFGSVSAILPGTGWFKMPAIDRLLLQGAEAKRVSSAVKQTDLAIKRLEQLRTSGQTAFLWVHYFEPHEPYDRHAGFDFGDGKRNAYLSEVAFVDRELGRLLAHLSSAHWLEDSLVLIFADHGESLGEQNRFGHHVSLDASIIDIPLIMYYPGASAKAVQSIVGIADVTPTVLDFADLPVPRDLNARSLYATLEQPAPRSVVAESFPIRGEQLFEMANEPILTLEQLLARVDTTYRQGARSYDPKVSLVQQQHRLVVDRMTGDELLSLREGPSRDRRVTAVDAALLAQMQKSLGEWHEREAELIYCRVVAHRR